MWCLCPSDGARCCLARHGASWEKYSTPWRGRRSARSLRTPAAGPCAHVHRDSSEVSGGLGDRISEREKRHSYGPLVLAKSGISRASTSGPVDTQCPRWVSSWSKFANTSANKRPRMVIAAASKLIHEGAL